MLPYICLVTKNGKRPVSFDIVLDRQMAKWNLLRRNEVYDSALTLLFFLRVSIILRVRSHISSFVCQLVDSTSGKKRNWEVRVGLLLVISVNICIVLEFFKNYCFQW